MKVVKAKMIEETREDKLLYYTLTNSQMKSLWLRVLIIVLNALPYITGSGTILFAFNGSKAPKINFIIGVIQFMIGTSFFYLGVIWAIAWAIIIVFINRDREEMTNSAGTTV